jgi:hypothetical protein
MELAYSVNGVPIRLTDERWTHIVENHDEMAGRLTDVLEVVESPDWITQGHRGALVAWKGYGRSGFLCVHYRELSEEDGFIITAYLTRKSRKERKLWPK